MTLVLSASLPFQLTPKLSQPIITFQYADDTIIMLSALGNTLRSLLLIIHCFEESSSLKVNFSKSSFVPFSVPAQHLHSIERLLGCKQQSLPITYLGMPLSLRAPKREDYMPVLQKLEGRLQGWKARFISRAGKLQLVKTVLSAIPTYFMSCFTFPKWLIARIDAIRRQFLWSRAQASKPTHLLNWQAACLLAVNGGLGVTNLLLQNISLLLRWWWKIYAPSHTLWNTYATRIYAVQPSDQGTLFLTTRGSFFWNSILKIKPIFNSSVQIRLVSGQQTSFWQDPWVGQPLSLGQFGPLTHRTISVHDVKSCFHRLIPSPLTLHQSEAHERINLFTPQQGPDIFTWNLSSSGAFTVSSIYKVLS